jgi:hypothetical protein
MLLAKFKTDGSGKEMLLELNSAICLITSEEEPSTPFQHFIQM